MFDDEQAVALAIALQLASTSSAGIGEAAVRALTTVRQVMPARLRRRIDTLQVTAIARPGSLDPEVSATVLTKLSAAVHASEVLRFDYERGSGSAKDDATSLPPRRVEPHHLITWGGRWYLVAWDLDRQGWRTFRSDRISPRTPTGPQFSARPIPGGDVHTFVISTFRGLTGTGEWPCQGEVILDLPMAEVSPYVGEGVVEELRPGRCRVVMGAWSWAGLAATLGRFDGDIEVVGPRELTAAFAALARRYAKAAEGEPVADGAAS